MTTKRTDTLQERIDRLVGTDFMMMDIHRPMTDAEIEEVNPQALVDKSAGTVENDDGSAAGVGASHEEEPKRYTGPFVVYPDNVEVLDVNTSHELEVNRVLQSAFDNELVSVVVIGQREDGSLYLLASDPDVGSANLLCDRAKAELLDAINTARLREDPRGPKEHT